MENNLQFEIADVLNRYLESYMENHNITYHQHKVLNAIMICRTSRLGGHIEKCNNSKCDYETIAYNSCRNRHCPKCGGSKKIQWISERLKEILPIPYFHVVFTMPSTLRLLSLYNQSVIYDLFFKASSYTLKIFAKDKKYLGATLGFMGILHTWGQTLIHHPHIHYIVTGGGLKSDKSKWVNLPYQKKFIFPVKAMSKVMGAKFITLLKEAYQDKLIQFPHKLCDIAKPISFHQFCSKLYDENWYIYAKPPFSGPDTVIKYFSRYTHRVAISNNRLINIDSGKISFKYKDYKEDAKSKIMTLSADSFLQRLLWHILPSGFRKIRYYGILSSGLKTISLKLIRQLLESVGEIINHNIHDLIPIFEHLCPKCKKGQLIIQINSA